jgi:hypothetical protein
VVAGEVEHLGSERVAEAIDPVISVKRTPPRADACGLDLVDDSLDAFAGRCTENRLVTWPSDIRGAESQAMIT